MKKHVCGIVMALALCLGMLPVSVLADLDIDPDLTDSNTDSVLPAPVPSEPIDLNDDAGIPAELSFSGGAGTADSPHLISNLSDLEAFRDSVNNGTTYEGEYIRLTADIDLSGKYGENKGSWTPIGKEYNPSERVDRRFKGTFDGGGHTITGLYINSTENYVGLFGWGENCVIKNLTMADGEVTTTAMQAGAVVGIINGSVINCHNQSVNVTARHFAGGIAGQIETSMISDGYTPESTGYVIEGCSNMADIAGTGSAECGGIVALLNAARVNNCLNLGNLSNGSSGLYCGGIVGMNQHGAVSNCFSSANISKSEAYPDYAGGGIVGRVDSREYALSVTNCFYITDESLYGIGRLSGDMPGGAKRVMDEEAASGEVAYLLQQVQKNGQVWGQRLYGGAPDSTPVLSVSSAEKVVKISFIVQAPDIYAVQYINAGQKAAAPPEPPAQGGLPFRGWSVASGGSMFDLNSAVTGDLTLYAQWGAEEPGQVRPNTPGSSNSGSSDHADRSDDDTEPADLPVNTAGQNNASIPTQTTASLSASVRDGTASSRISADVAAEMVRQAVSNNSETVVIAPEITGNAVRTEVYIPASTLRELNRRTNADLMVSTPAADVIIPNSGLGALANRGGTVTVAVEKLGNAVELALTAGGRAVGAVSGGVTLTVPVSNAAPGTVAVLIHEDGTREIIRKSTVRNGSLTVPLEGSAKIEILNNGGSFADVPSGGWAADAVAFVTARQLFNGTSDTTFSPNSSMTRAMLAVVLHNLEGNPAPAVSGSFADVSDNAWYAGAVNWAGNAGIVAGYADGMFGPNNSITREQLAVILWRSAGNPAPSSGALPFTDADQAGEYARDALCWAVENGVMSGRGGGILDPRGIATRAQTAQMLKNFMENI